jgi:hypothetical protein
MMRGGVRLANRTPTMPARQGEGARALPDHTDRAKSPPPFNHLSMRMTANASGPWGAPGDAGSGLSVRELRW